MATSRTSSPPTPIPESLTKQVTCASFRADRGNQATLNSAVTYEPVNFHRNCRAVRSADIGSPSPTDTAEPLVRREPSTPSSGPCRRPLPALAEVHYISVMLRSPVPATAVLKDQSNRLDLATTGSRQPRSRRNNRARRGSGRP